MIKRFEPVPFEETTKKINYTLKDDLKIYEEALENRNLINVKLIDGGLKTFTQLAYILKSYLDKDKKGQPYVDTVESLQTIKNILDEHTQVKWLGAKTPYGGRFFYGFTEYDFPSDVKKSINKKYKDIKKQNSNREEEVLQSK